MTYYAPIIEMCLLEVHQKGEAAIKTICNCKIPSDVMLFEYRRLNLKLEDLSAEEKKEMWEFACAAFPDKSKEEKINVCKIIHTIGAIL